MHFRISKARQPQPVRRAIRDHTCLAEQRRHQIVLELQRTGQARTSQLAENFGVSEVTIRSDLEILDAKKQLIKTHGGAIALPASSPAAAFEERMNRNFDAKRRIAQMAARQIIDNQSVVFDSGSTLPAGRHADAAGQQCRGGHNGHEYCAASDVSAGAGRAYDWPVASFPAPSAQSCRIPTKPWAVLWPTRRSSSAHAIDHSFDVVDVSEDIARTKRNLVRMARRVILVADSSKWDIGASSKAFSLSRVDLIITDTGMPHGIRSRLDKTGRRGALCVGEFRICGIG